MELEIIKQSKELQKEASCLLDKYDLLVRLREYGEVRAIGSYHYRVMTTPDIDIHILNNQATKETALKIFLELMQLEDIVSVKITDFVKYRKQLAHNPSNLPPLSYFIGARVWYNERLWRIDISFLKEKQDEVDEYEKYFSKIDEPTREKMVLFKNRVKNDTNINCYSKDIYRAFMNGNIQEYEDLISYLEKI